MVYVTLQETGAIISGQRSKVKTRRYLIALQIHKPPLTNESEFSQKYLTETDLVSTKKCSQIRNKHVYTTGFVIYDILL